MDEGAKEKGLTNTTVVLMICVALFYDALQWLLGWIFMGWLVTIYAGLTFYVWFKIKGISFMKLKRLATFSGSFIIELIPVIGDVLPAWTASIVYLAIDSKIKKVAGAIPGGNIALSAAGNKIIRNKNMARVNNMGRVKPMSGNSEEIKEASRKRGIEHNTKMEEDKKNFEARNKRWEEQRQEQHKFEEEYGGYQKYDKDLSELRYKYRNSSSSTDKAA